MTAISKEGQAFSPVARATLGICALWIVSLLVIAQATAVYAENVEIVLEFDESELSFAQEKGSDVVELLQTDTYLHGKPGHPLLPLKGVQVLLPPDTDVEDVWVRVEDETVLPGEFTILHAQPFVPLSRPDLARTVPPDPEVYSSDEPFPAEAAELANVGTMRGYRIAALRVRPVAFQPQSKVLTLRKRITIELGLRGLEETQVSPKYKSEVFESLVRSQVVNPEDIDNYKTYFTKRSQEADDVSLSPTLDKVPTGGGGYLPLSGGGLYTPPNPDDVKYLMIGDESMQTVLEPLLDWKTQKGIPAAFVSWQYIDQHYSGVDRQLRIKYCIRDYANNKGTEWVVLVGDSLSTVRYAYGEGAEGKVKRDDLPCDLYYAALDYGVFPPSPLDWDYDDDGIYGETEDNPDLYADVFLGRFPIQTTSHAQAVVQKTIAYEKQEQATGSFFRDLLCAMHLWPGLDVTDGQRKSDLMWGHPLLPLHGPYVRFYNTTDTVNAVNLTTKIESGFNCLHMATHGGENHWVLEFGNYYTGDAALLYNPDKYTNILTIACHTNAFDTEPCLSEAFLRNSDGGAATYIGSSREGWGDNESYGLGPSFQFDQRFYAKLFGGLDPLEGPPQRIGAVYKAMKNGFSSHYSSYNEYRWLLFSVNLMGDPELCLFTNSNEAPEEITGLQFEQTIPIGQQTYSVTMNPIIEDARFCLWKGDEVYVYGTADENGTFEAEINPQTIGDILLTVTAPNRIPFTTNVTVACAVQFAEVESEEWEYGILAQVQVVLSPASSEMVTVDFYTTDGTASEPSDYYVLGAQTVYFDPPGSTSETINTIFIVNDSLDEDDETFSVVLTDPVGAVLGPVSSHTVTIKDNDPEPTVGFEVTEQTVVEDDGTATVCVTLSTESGREVTVDYETSDGSATAPGDYVHTSDTVTFQPGQVEQFIEVTLTSDQTPEANEWFWIDLSNPTNAGLGADSHEVTIVDNVVEGPVFDVKAGGNVVAKFQNNGNIWLKGSLGDNPSPSGSETEFIVNSSQQCVALIDADGNLHIEGTLSENVISITLTSSPEFAVEDSSTEDIVCRIDSSGNLDTTGVVIENRQGM